jgi:hypothetical protein
VVAERLRFAVGDAAAPRTGLFSVVADLNAEHVYVFARGLGGVFKASLHPNTEWRIAFTREYAETEDFSLRVGGEDRLVASWRRPDPLYPGLSLGFRLLVVPDPEPRDDPPHPATLWCPPPADGQLVVLGVFLEARDGAFKEWRARQSKPTEVLAHVRRGDLEDVVLAYAYEDVASVQPVGSRTAHLPTGVSKEEVIAAARERRAAMLFPEVDEKGGLFYHAPLRVEAPT